jgi:hypothetical protein
VGRRQRACGTGNFLYVTLDFFKRLEAEVVALLGELEEKQILGEMAGYGVTHSSSWASR